MSSTNVSNENEFETTQNSVQFPPPRTPLNTITDPFQLESSQPHKSSNKKIEASNYVTPRVLGRHGRAQSEPNSVQSTPARTGPRISLGGKGVSSSSTSRVSRGVSIVNSEFSTEIPHFEDAAFSSDHNVQVLIRIRPLSTMERVSQGYGRCLRQESAQTLVWLGHPETRFTFDHIACETISQEKLFKVAGLPMVENCMSGYNSCMFAYGQTGSGKTYTMMGEIYEVEGKLNEDCGITPRIFEYLFSRIRTEEESRKDEKLKFSCKCSFLEIYNEQITDLLEPSSTNLQLREDLKKGVYVENLAEYNVRNVTDVVKLLLRGAANRKMAATHMNSESSRSHSVFTCIIESHWEKDSMTHFRFARLNLVDLAGSERQKSSGAEGDRLKEAANINKSLSTLGLVIMSLVDLAHGKHRHVPYRDSRLTFLLQDSLGGNSKTTIIANVSPSICSVNETLSTLKFAQRAKLIQNNAKVNEDASGDVTALQRQIQLLKGQLSSLMEHHNFSRSLSSCGPSFEESRICDSSERYDSFGQRTMTDKPKIQRIQNKKTKRMEATLVSSLRREKMAKVALQKLEAEIEHMNRLACQREEDAQRIKMMLRFREEKIKQLELLVNGSVSAEKYLMEENKALKEEIQLLQARIDRNPELTRFALENIRLLEQLQLFQNFYEQGERETLLAEVSELRDQLLEVLEGKQGFSSRYENQDNVIVKELEDCRNMNSKLMREVDELRTELRKYLNCSQEAFDSVTSSFSKDPEELRQTDKYSLVETISIRSDSGDEMASYTQADDVALQNNNGQNMSDASALQLRHTQKELMDARLLIEAMESEQVHLIEELQLMQEQNHRYKEILSNKDKVGRDSVLKLKSHYLESDDLEKVNKGPVMEDSEGINRKTLQAKLDKLTKDLEEARSLNCHYQEDQSSQLSLQQEVDLVREEVEMETTRTILHLQEEVAALQVEIQERFCCTSQEDVRLRNTIAAQEEKIRAICEEWERATLELTSFLLDGSRSLKDASGQVESIACSFPQVNVWINDHVERAVRVCIEKEETILLLQKSLEDTQKMVLELEMKLSSLKGATIALNESQQQDNDGSPEEAIQLSMLLNEKIDMVNMLEGKLKIKVDQLIGAERRADAAFLVVKWLSDCQKFAQRNDTERDIPTTKFVTATEMGNQLISEMKTNANALAVEDIKAQVELARLGVLESENAINASYADAEVHIAALETDIVKAASASRELVQDLVREIHEIRSKFMELKEDHKKFQFCTVNLQSLEVHKSVRSEIQCPMLHQIKDELTETNDRLNIIKDCIITRAGMYVCPSKDEDLIYADGSSADCSTSGSDFWLESVASGNNLDGYACYFRFPGNITEQMVDLEFQGGSVHEANDQEPKTLKKLLEKSIHEEAMTLSLRKELEMAYNSFNKLYVWLTSIGDCSGTKEMNQVIPSFGLTMEKAEAGCHSTSEAVADEKIVHGSSFLKTFEEAHATMKEADFMLNALMDSNENAKQLNGMWRKAGEELLVERASLIEEVEILKSSISLKERENELLRDQIHCSPVDIAKSVSLFEGCFLQVQREVEDRFKVLYSDVLSMEQEMFHFICNSRSSLEDIWFEIMEKEFALFVQYQCHIGAFIRSIPSFNVEPGFHPFRQQESQLLMSNSQKICSTGQDDIMITHKKDVKEGDQSELVTNLEDGELDLSFDNLIFENSSLKKELERKEVLLEGLLFDFSLLQESASNTKDIKDETEKLILALSHVRHELEIKTSQVDDLLVQQRKLESHLTDAENALFLSNSDLEQAKETTDTLIDQNTEFKMLIKDLYLRKSEAEQQLEEQKEVVKGLEKEILHLTSSVEKNLVSSVEGIEEDLRKVVSERDKLYEEVCSLNEKLEMAYALSDENEAIAVEARQESEASKIYAEQKEEEVKILEHSVEELECTINVLEKKVYEMDEEVERHRLIRDSLELELQALRQRLSTVENLTDIMDSENRNGEQAEDQISRQLHSKLLELHEAHNRIRLIEKERAEQKKEIKQCKEYISELVLHSEAQASQYQQKYKTLEAMVREVKTDLLNSTATAPIMDKTEKSSTRARGSSSPFRCIVGLVQQMNVEKDQELSMARLRIEELETLAASQQKELCMLNTRLAAAESMTHDVIRDLLGVKLDMTNYANLIDQQQVQKLVEEAHQQAEEVLAKEQEVLNLRKRIDDLIQERESCISEMNNKETDILAAQMAVEQLQDRDQLLSAHNEMLKMDKTNLLRRIAELDEMVKTLLGTQSTQRQIRQTSNIKENGLSKVGDADFTNRLAHSEKLLSEVNDELAQYRKPSGSHPRDKTVKTYGHGHETKYRKEKA